MRAYISAKGDDPVLIIEAELEREAVILHNFGRILGPLKAEIIHPPDYGAPCVEIKRDKS